MKSSHICLSFSLGGMPNLRPTGYGEYFFSTVIEFEIELWMFER